MKECNFNINLPIIICGWNISDKNFKFANVLIQLASFAIYKSKMIYNVTKKIIPIKILFKMEIKHLDEITSNCTRISKKIISKDKLSHCKIFWNVK